MPKFFVTFVFGSLILGICLGACFVINKGVDVLPLPNEPEYKTESAVKAHLHNGEVVVMPEGFSIVKDGNLLNLIPNNTGMRYDLIRKDSSLVLSLPRNEIAFIEVYSNQIDGAALVTGIPAAIVTGAVAAVAIFGSCPTYYSYDGLKYHLEAEGFSYSIVPTFEAEDLDRLHFLDAKNGMAKIIVKNEALETHYIDQLSLVSVDHAPEVQAFASFSKNPLSEKKIILTEQPIQIGSAFSKQDEDILESIKYRDDLWHRSPISEVEALSTDPVHKDWIDIEFRVPEHHEKIYLTMNLRNSLMNSVFLYDILLDAQNFGAIDWLDKTMNNWFQAFQFYKWYNEYFGMSVEIFENERYREVHHFGDLGPISWSERALEIPIKKGGLVKLRLKYMPDNWHIDWVGVALKGNTEVDQVEHRMISSSGFDATEEPLLSRDDGRYFIQYPGHATQLEVEAVPSEPGMQRSWFIRSKGYYTEWLRTAWLEPRADEELSSRIEISDELIRELAKEWILKKDNFEKLFFETMIPVSQSEM